MFRIAEAIGHTVSYIEHNMSIDELSEWAAWFELKHEAQEKQLKNIKSKRK